MRGSYFSPLHFGYLVALLPLVTIHVTFLVSLAQGHIDACNPYWTDCVSISKTGRHGTAYFIFKGGMIPTAVLMFVYWFLNRQWVISLTQREHRTLIYFGLVGSMALITYTLALGHVGDGFRLLRRFGVVLFIFCTFICQVKFASDLSRIGYLRASANRLLVFSSITLIIAVFSLILDVSLGKDYDRLENLFEWWLIVLLIVHQFCVVRIWQKHKFHLNVVSHEFKV